MFTQNDKRIAHYPKNLPPSISTFTGGAVAVFLGLSDPMGWLLILMGLFYTPMALLSIAILRTVAALNPIHLTVSIGRIFDKYLAVVGLLLVVLVGIPIVSKVILTGMVKSGSLALAFVAFLGSFAVSVYIFCLQTYLLGLIYRGNRDELGW